MPAAGDDSWHSLETLAGEVSMPVESVNVSDEFKKIQGIIAKSGGDRARNLSERSLTMFAEGRHETAIETITKAISVHPNNAVLRCNRSSMYLRMGRLDDALRDSKICCLMQPSWPQSHLVCGKVLLQMGCPSKAVSSLNIAISCSNDPIPEAEELLRNIRRSTTASPPSHNHSPTLPSPSGTGYRRTIIPNYTNYAANQSPLAASPITRFEKRQSRDWQEIDIKSEAYAIPPAPIKTKEVIEKPRPSVTQQRPLLIQSKEYLGIVGIIGSLLSCIITTASVCAVGKLSGEPRGCIIQLGLTATWGSVMSAHFEKRIPWKRCVGFILMLGVTLAISGVLLPLYYVATSCLVVMQCLSVITSSRAAVGKIHTGLFSRFLMFVGVSHQVFGSISGVWYRNPVFAILSLVSLTAFAAPLHSDTSLLQPFGISSREWLWVLINAVLGSALLAAINTTDIPCKCYHDAYTDNSMWWFSF